MEMPKIYLAGPEVFYPNAVAIGEKHKELELGTGFGNLIVNEEVIKEWI